MEMQIDSQDTKQAKLNWARICYSTAYISLQIGAYHNENAEKFPGYNISQIQLGKN